MQKLGPRRSINPYDPFLGIATAVTRMSVNYDRPLHFPQCLTREQAIRMYTSNNAWLMFKEREVGSLESGKLADFIVIDRDVLECHFNDIAKTKVLRTYLVGGKLTKVPDVRKKRDVVLRWLVTQFEEGRRYSEAEVNELIGRIHPDFATLRRELVGAKLMERREGVYWRVSPETVAA